MPEQTPDLAMSRFFPLPGKRCDIGAVVAAVGMSVPERAVASAEVAALLGVEEEWIVSRTGVRERRIAAEGESLAAHAAAAGRQALERAGVEAGELDLVIVATMAADDLTPNAAPLVAAALGAERAGAFDVGAACSGFLTALALACGQVESGRAGRVLAIGADLLSRLTDPGDRGTAALFADGAGAALVSASDAAAVGGWADGAAAIGPVVLRAAGDAERWVHASHDERQIHMQGHEVFREAVARLCEATLEVLARAGLDLADVDLFVYHQANARILDAVGERLGLPADRVVDCIDRFGNTSSATIPIALADAEARGLLRDGDTVLLGAFGAGLTWGAGLLRWGAAP